MTSTCNDCGAKNGEDEIPPCPENHIANIGSSGLCQHCDSNANCVKHPNQVN